MNQNANSAEELDRLQARWQNALAQNESLGEFDWRSHESDIMVCRYFHDWYYSMKAANRPIPEGVEPYTKFAQS